MTGECQSFMEGMKTHMLMYVFGFISPFVLIGAGILLFSIRRYLLDLYFDVPYGCAVCSWHYNDSGIWYPDVVFAGNRLERWWEWLRHRWSREHRANARLKHRKPGSNGCLIRDIYRGKDTVL